MHPCGDPLYVQLPQGLHRRAPWILSLDPEQLPGGPLASACSTLETGMKFSVPPGFSEITDLPKLLGGDKEVLEIVRPREGGDEGPEHAIQCVFFQHTTVSVPGSFCWPCGKIMEAL